MPSALGTDVQAEELPENLLIVPDSEYAVEVKADFEYDSVELSTSSPSSEAPVEEAEGGKVDKPFTLRNIALRIPRGKHSTYCESSIIPGALVCVVGRVGIGKTALLCGMINEMRRSRGFVKFGGRVTYVPQVAWLQSATLRDNILFGSDSKDADLQRVDEVIDACGLRVDVDAWHDADL